MQIGDCCPVRLYSAVRGIVLRLCLLQGSYRRAMGRLRFYGLLLRLRAAGFGRGQRFPCRLQLLLEFCCRRLHNHYADTIVLIHTSGTNNNLTIRKYYYRLETRI